MGPTLPLKHLLAVDCLETLRVVDSTVSGSGWQPLLPRTCLRVAALLVGEEKDYQPFSRLKEVQLIARLSSQQYREEKTYEAVDTLDRILWLWGVRLSVRLNR